MKNCCKIQISLDYGIEPAIIIDNILSENLNTNSNHTNIFPVNVANVEGVFEAGDIVAIKNNVGKKIGIGIAEYNKVDLLDKIAVKDESYFYSV